MKYNAPKNKSVNSYYDSICRYCDLESSALALYSPQPGPAFKKTLKYILGLIASRIKEAAKSGANAVLKGLKTIYSYGKKALVDSKFIPKLINAIKDFGNNVASKIGGVWGAFVRKIQQMIIDSYEKDIAILKEKARAAREVAKAKAKSEAAKAVTKLAKKGKKSANLTISLGDSANLLRLCEYSAKASLNASKVYGVMTRVLDDRRRISTTKTPTMWEIRQVLGVRPGVSFNEKDWKAYKENGLVIVENKRNGQRYQRSINELISIANQEKEAIENRQDPFTMSAMSEYNSDYIPRSEKPKIEKILKSVGRIIGIISGAVITINTVKKGTKGWSNDIRDLLANLLLTKEKYLDLQKRLIRAQAKAKAAKV